MFCIYLRTNSDLCHLQHKLIGFYNRDEKCLQRGTDWVFKYSGLPFVFKGLSNKIRNNIIKQKMNVTRSLLEDIKTKQLKWYGHVQRMEEGRLPKIVMKCSPPGRKKRGRPKLTWAEDIIGLMEEKGLMEEDWNDRDKWRKKVIYLSNGRRKM